MSDARDIEKLVFRKLLANPKTLAANLTKLSPSDFTIPIAKDVVSALQNNGYSIHYSPNKAYFEILLRDRIRDKQSLDSACESLVKLANATVDQSDIDILIRELKREKMCAELTNIIRSVTSRIDPSSIDDVYKELMEKLLRLPLGGESVGDTGSLKNVHDDVADRINMIFTESTRKFSTGIKAFDRAIGGYAPGEFIVLAAGSGQGKSAMMLWLTEKWLSLNANVMYVTIEMPYEDTMDRYHAMITGLDTNKIRNRCLNEGEIARYIEYIIARTKTPDMSKKFLEECDTIVDRLNPKYAMDIAMKYPNRKNKFFVLDIARGCTPTRLEQEIIRLSLDAPIHFVVVDYINIMTPNYHNKDYVREQASIAQDLKSVFRRTKTIGLVGAQLNTTELEDADKIKMTDIRYAKAIAENCDWMMAFNRNSDDELAKQIRVELVKHRFAPAAVALLEFDFKNMQVIDLGSADDNPLIQKSEK